MAVVSQTSAANVQTVRGASVGSIIIFHPDDSTDLPDYLTYEKPYVIHSIDETYGVPVAVFIDDTGDDSSYGSVQNQKFRVIYTPEQQEQFIPVTITLETQNEVNLIASLLAQTTGVIDVLFGNPDETVLRLYQGVNKFATEQQKIGKAHFHIRN